MKLKSILMCCFLLMAGTVMAGTDGKKTGAPEGVVAVDLGLPSGLKWANMNVGATKPEGYGDYFAWGETEAKKSKKSMKTYKFQYSRKDPSDTTPPMTKYWPDGAKVWIGLYSFPSKGDNKTVLEPEDDAAVANWGDGWRMPTSDEAQELEDNTTQEFVTVNGVNGVRFISKTNGNSIFLPTAGLLKSTRKQDWKKRGTYWTSSLFTNDPIQAQIFGFYFPSSYFYTDHQLSRSSVASIRAVKK
ncbi:MAG: hypothetical protein IJ588_01535 [Prevotella sp.]|nr:hypothetical protein [Prevotella sp.]